ncbi:FAD/NAD-P-binding domain-containing protein [Amylocystis lapponica]|nr:FAD/NAD-P-binding domain-containing protein [Amylocystis lapponica]
MDPLPAAALDSLHIDTSSHKNICVIGAGPSGLAALKIIADTPQYKAGLWHPTAFERREEVGGIWLPAPPTADPPATPLYDSLTTNLPHPLMAYSSFSSRPRPRSFPRSYAEHFQITPHIRLRTAVTAASWDTSTATWTVDLSDGQKREFDFLIVANGHYYIPRFPDTPGVAAWLAAGKATHAAWFRRPSDLGHTVLVVGGGPSGIDISAEMRTTANTVIHSITDGVREDLDGGAFKRRGRVAEFLAPSSGTVRFEDGTSDTSIDHCILATGYQYAYPFFAPDLLVPAAPPPVPPLPARLHNSTYGVFPLARHLFPLAAGLPPGALALLGLPMRVAPLPLIEAQMRAAVRVFAEPAALDAAQEARAVVARHAALRTELGTDDEAALAREWLRFKVAEQFAYRDALDVLAGSGERVPAWASEIYPRSLELREEWRALERAGEAEKWVRGVGEGGTEEWVDLMRRLLRRRDERKERENDKE